MNPFFERGPSFEKPPFEEKKGDTERKKTITEQKETIINQEKTILDKIEVPDKAKKIVNTMLLMTLLATITPKFSPKAYAEQGRQPVKQEQVQQEQDKTIWASQSERPEWIYQEPKEEGGYEFFCGESGKFATEKGAMDAAYRDAISKAAFKKTGGEGTVTIENPKVIEYYVEQKQTASGKTYYKAFALVEAPITNLGKKTAGQPQKRQQLKKEQPQKITTKEKVTKPGKKQEQVQQKQTVDKINEANLTDSSIWAGDIIKKAHADLKNVKNSEDAEWFVRSYFDSFISEYYLPTKGNLKEGPYGIKRRECSEDDIKFLLQNAKEMEQILENLNKKYGIEAYNEYREQIDDIIKKLELQSSFSSQKQKEILNKIDEMLQK